MKTAGPLSQRKVPTDGGNRCTSTSRHDRKTQERLLLGSGRKPGEPWQFQFMLCDIGIDSRVHRHSADISASQS